MSDATNAEFNAWFASLCPKDQKNGANACLEIDTLRQRVKELETEMALLIGDRRDTR